VYCIKSRAQVNRYTIVWTVVSLSMYGIVFYGRNSSLIVDKIILNHETKITDS